MRFTAAPGLGDALRNRDDDRAWFIFTGDLNQMGIMYRRLLEAGFPVVKNGVYPGFQREQEDEYLKALRFIFSRRIEGWWNQERELIQYSVCTQEGFDQTLGRKS